ncbi:MAG: MobF family relaxase [Dissulfurispiraceae bacterium]
MRPVNISAERATEYYYERDPLFNDGAAQNNIQWYGDGATRLGLDSGDAIKRNDFSKIVEGKDIQGNQLVESGGIQHKHVAGTDIPLTPPKSVSITALVAGDERLIDSHRAAVLQTADYLEQRYPAYRETINGVTQSVKSDNLTFAVFHHSTSRANDPNLHSHMITMNIVHTCQGDWKALDNRQFFNDQKLINAVYQSYLSEHVKQLGYSIEHRANGCWEIAGIRQDDIDRFSKRSFQIQEKEAALREKGEIQNDGLINKVATLDSRPNKNNNITEQELKHSWREQLQGRDISIEQLKNDLKSGSEKSIESKNLTASDYIRTAATQLSDRESVLRKSEILKLSLNLANGVQNSVDHTHKAFDELINSGDLKSLRTDARGRELFATKEILGIERGIIDDVNGAKGQWESAADKEAASTFIEARENVQGWQYTDGQRQAIELILTSPDSVNLIQGNAGTGKTEMFGAVKEYGGKEGLQIIGIAATGKATKEIADKGIASYTIDSFLSKALTLTERTIVIMDESSMSGSRQTAEVMERTQEAGAKLVFVGDMKQFSSISAGRMFDEVQQRTLVDKAEITEVMRARTDYMRAVYSALNEKNDRGDIDTENNVDKAFSILEREGKIIEARDRDTGLMSVVNAYFDKPEEEKTVILTARNDDRREINELVRHERIEQEEIDKGHRFQTLETVNVNPEQSRFADAYREGQIIVAFSDTENLKSGTKATIVDVDRENNILTVAHKDKAGTEILSEINTLKDNNQFAVYAEKETELSKGDRITFLKNDSHLNVENGLTGTVSSIAENGAITVATDTGKTVSFNIEEGGRAYNYIDHAYCLTEVKSQGATYQNVIAYSQADEYSHHSYNSFYVDATRASHDFLLVTNDAGMFKEQVSNFEMNSSTLSYQSDMQNEKAETLHESEQAASIDHCGPGNDKSQDAHDNEISQ